MLLNPAPAEAQRSAARVQPGKNGLNDNLKDSPVTLLADIQSDAAERRLDCE